MEEKAEKVATAYTMSEGVPIFLKSTYNLIKMWLNVGFVPIPTWTNT